MRKLLLLLLLFAPALQAQNTSVSGTITDAGGQAWSYGSYSFSFVPAPINPQGPYHFQGATFNTSQVISGSLNASGAFSGATVPDNTFITPSGSAWLFKACPASTTSCFTKVFTISGVSEDLTGSFTPPAIVLDLGSPPPNGASAYSDSEVTNGRPGSLYYNITMNTLRFCQVTPFPPCSWMSNTGTGTVTSFSAGNLSPLFTTSVATATTTPALSFAQISQAQNLVYASPNGSAGVPTFRALVAGDLPAGGGTVSSFSAGIAVPFFTTSVATATTTPALTFNVTSQTANTVAAGPTSGGAVAPTFRSLVTDDLPDSGVVAGSCGSATSSCALAIDVKGRVTSQTDTPITSIVPVQAFADKSQAGNVTITSAATTITSQAITMPGSGCPCRVMYAFSVYLSFAGAVNQNNIDVWVSDGSNNFRGVETGQSNAATGAATMAAYTGWSTVTYSNGATVTFTLKGQLPGSTALAQAAVTTGAGPNAGLTLAAFASN